MDPITAYLIQLAIGLVVSGVTTLAQQAFAPKPKAQKNLPGLRGQYSTGGTVPMTIVLGTYGIPGQLEYSNCWGNSGETPNAFLVDVISLSDHRITAVSKVWVDSGEVTLSGSGALSRGYPFTEYASGGKDHAWYKFYTGSQSTADAYLIDKFGSDAERPWLSDMKGQGIAYAIQTARINETLWTDFPRYMYEVQGAPVFDPRLSTAAGGSGSQVWGTFSTYAFSDNPIVLAMNCLMGIHDSSGNHLWGGHATLAQFDYANIAAAMNACDASVTLKAGGTEKRYRAGIEISHSDRTNDVVRDLLVACNGRVTFSRGKYWFLVDEPSSAAASFTDDDLLIEEPIDFSWFPNLDEAVNGATATFLAPQRAWEEKETKPYYSAALETEDGKAQREKLQLRCVFSGSQAQRILKAVVEQSRKFKRHVVCLPDTFRTYLPLQCLAWTSDEFQYSSKLFLILSRTEDEWGRIWFALQEIDPADFDWTASTDETTLTYASTEAVPVPSQAVAGWSATAYTDGRRPGVDLAWTGAMDDVRATRVQIRRTSDAGLFFDREFPFDITAATQHIYVLGDPLVRATGYDARALHIPFDGSGRQTTWSSWLSFTTPDVGVGLVDIDSSVGARLTWLAQSVQQSRKQFEETILRVRDLSQHNQGMYQELRRSAEVSRGNDRVYYDEQIDAALAYTDAGVDAVAASLAALGIIVNDPSTGVVATANSLAATILTVTGQGATLTAQGALLNAIDATLGDVSAGAKFWADVVATAAGFDASVGMGAYGSNGTTKAAAAIIADAKNDGTGRIRLIGDKVYLQDSLGNIYTAFDASGAYLSNARIKDLEVQRLTIAGRGATSEDITFEHNASAIGTPANNRVAWSAGRVSYIDDTGTPTYADISAGSNPSANGGTTEYIYWVKGATTFSVNTTRATAMADGNVLVATYKGGKKLNVKLGTKLVLDGDDLKGLSVLRGGIANGAITDADTDIRTTGTFTMPATHDVWGTRMSISVAGASFAQLVGALFSFTSNAGTTGWDFKYRLQIEASPGSGSYVTIVDDLTQPASGDASVIKVWLSAIIPPLAAGNYVVRAQMMCGFNGGGYAHTITRLALASGLPTK